MMIEYFKEGEELGKGVKFYNLLVRSLLLFTHFF
jgi:hypothetical protein